MMNNTCFMLWSRQQKQAPPRGSNQVKYYDTITNKPYKVLVSVSKFLGLVLVSTSKGLSLVAFSVFLGLSWCGLYYIWTHMLH